MNTFSCKLVTPEKILFEDSVWQVSIKTESNSFALRSRHADLLFTADLGTIEIAITPDSRQEWEVSDSILEFANNDCSIICRSAQPIAK